MGTLSLDAIIASAGQALVTTSLDGLQALKRPGAIAGCNGGGPVAGATAGLDALLSVTGGVPSASALCCNLRKRVSFLLTD